MAKFDAVRQKTSIPSLYSWSEPIAKTGSNPPFSVSPAPARPVLVLRQASDGMNQEGSTSSFGQFVSIPASCQRGGAVAHWNPCSFAHLRD